MRRQGVLEEATAQQVKCSQIRRVWLQADHLLGKEIPERLREVSHEAGNHLFALLNMKGLALAPKYNIHHARAEGHLVEDTDHLQVAFEADAVSVIGVRSWVLQP